MDVGMDLYHLGQRLRQASRVHAMPASPGGAANMGVTQSTELRHLCSEMCCAEGTAVVTKDAVITARA